MAVVFTPDASGQAASPVALAAGFWLLAGTLTFSGSYATGGDALDLRNRFPAGRTIRSCVAMGTARGFHMEYIVATQLLKLVQATAITPTQAEHAAAAYAALMTASPVPVVFLMKG